MVQFGLRAHDLGPLPPEALADALAPFHPASIQLALAKAFTDAPSAGQFSPGYARSIRNIFASRGIAISVLGCYINPVHPDPDAREAALVRFEEHLRFARDFGCPIVGTETGSRNGDCSFHPDTDTEETFSLLCDSIARLVKTAEKYGSIVGVEAVAPCHTISSIEKMRRLLDTIDSPNLQVIYDPINLFPEHGLEESQKSFFERAFASFGHHIVAVHIKDFKMENGKKNGTLAPLSGVFDFASLLSLLNVHKPGIDVLLENIDPRVLEHTLYTLRNEAKRTL